MIQIDRDFIPIIEHKRWSWTDRENYIYGTTSPNIFTSIKVKRGDRFRYPNKRIGRVIMGDPPGKEVLQVIPSMDYRKKNLRLWDMHSHQVRTRKYITRNGTSIYKGVSLNPNTRKWKASCCFDHMHRTLGIFDTEEEAARAYNIASVNRYGDMASINIILRPTNPIPDSIVVTMKTLGKKYNITPKDIIIRGGYL